VGVVLLVRSATSKIRDSGDIYAFGVLICRGVVQMQRLRFMIRWKYGREIKEESSRDWSCCGSSTYTTKAHNVNLGNSVYFKYI
jgi:hypothetical protein